MGDREAIDYLRHMARPFLFTASATPGSLAAAAASLSLLEREPSMAAAVRERGAYLVNRLTAAGVPARYGGGAIVTIPTGSEFATMHAWRLLFNRGVYCNAVIAPAVPVDGGLLRLSVMRTHSDELIDTAVAAFDVLEEIFPATDQQQDQP